MSAEERLWNRLYDIFAKRDTIGYWKNDSFVKAGRVFSSRCIGVGWEFAVKLQTGRFALQKVDGVVAWGCTFGLPRVPTPEELLELELII